MVDLDLVITIKIGEDWGGIIAFTHWSFWVWVNQCWRYCMVQNEMLLSLFKYKKETCWITIDLQFFIKNSRNFIIHIYNQQSTMPQLPWCGHLKWIFCCNDQLFCRVITYPHSNVLYCCTTPTLPQITLPWSLLWWQLFLWWPQFGFVAFVAVQKCVVNTRKLYSASTTVDQDLGADWL